MGHRLPIPQLDFDGNIDAKVFFCISLPDGTRQHQAFCRMGELQGRQTCSVNPALEKGAERLLDRKSVV